MAIANSNSKVRKSRSKHAVAGEPIDALPKPKWYAPWLARAGVFFVIAWPVAIATWFIDGSIRLNNAPDCAKQVQGILEGMSAYPPGRDREVLSNAAPNDSNLMGKTDVPSYTTLDTLTLDNDGEVTGHSIITRICFQSLTANRVLCNVREHHSGAATVDVTPATQPTFWVDAGASRITLSKDLIEGVNTARIPIPAP